MVRLTNAQIQTYRVAKSLGNPFYLGKVAKVQNASPATIYNHAKELKKAGLVERVRKGFYNVIKDIDIAELKPLKPKRVKAYRDGLTVDLENEQSLNSAKNANVRIEKPTSLPTIKYKNGRPHTGIMPTYARANK